MAGVDFRAYIVEKTELTKQLNLDNQLGTVNKPPKLLAMEEYPTWKDRFSNYVFGDASLWIAVEEEYEIPVDENNIKITANTPEVGEARESLPVAYKGRDFSIAFNPEFLMAPLRNLTEDEVFFDLIDEMSPGVLKIQTPFLYVLMPMRVSS